MNRYVTGAKVIDRKELYILGHNYFQKMDDSPKKVKISSLEVAQRNVSFFSKKNDKKIYSEFFIINVDSTCSPIKVSEGNLAMIK